MNDLDNCIKVTYLISCTNFNEHYVGSAIDLKKHFRIHKSDIPTQSSCFLKIYGQLKKLV